MNFNFAHPVLSLRGLLLARSLQVKFIGVQITREPIQKEFAEKYFHTLYDSRTKSVFTADRIAIAHKKLVRMRNRSERNNINALALTQENYHGE